MGAMPDIRPFLLQFHQPHRCDPSGWVRATFVLPALLRPVLRGIYVHLDEHIIVLKKRFVYLGYFGPQRLSPLVPAFSK